MRKILVFIFFIIICIFSFQFYTSRENVIPVFNENINSYDIYLLDVSKEEITTNNIADIFDTIKILEIYPYINPIYKKLINLSNYSFNTILSNKKNISNFITEYLNQLENNKLKEELVKYSINGIKINYLKIYASNNDINKLISNYNMIKIK